MSKQPKVSIIVPCYKVEKYLRRSMDSLVNQTLDDVELICINDGSPDNCLSILKEYKEKYPEKNIVIIDKKNEGVWKGRFDGIKIATGKYITFTDSDDYVALDYAEKLYNAAEKNNSDILVCGYYRVDTDTEHVYSTEMNKYEGKHIDMDKNPEDILSINAALWNKLYKAEVLKNLKNLENPPKILDDMMFLLLAYLNTKKIDFINDVLYYYMVRQDSIIAKINKEQIAQFKNNADDLILRNMHNQASAELSQPKKMTNMAFRNWNKSAYSYNEKKRRFEFREELGRAADVPKYIKVEVL